MAKRRKGFTLGLDVSEILKEYSDEVQREVAFSAYEVGEVVVRSLHATSPKGNTGKYARGWTWDTVTTSHGLIQIWIHNETSYRLTHLLEYGHALVKGGRLTEGGYKVGEVRGIKHIQDRRDLAERELIKRVEERLNG